MNITEKTKIQLDLFLKTVNHLNALKQYSVNKFSDHIIIYTSNKNNFPNKIFHSTHLITLAESMKLNCYIDSDDNGYCYLYIF